MGCACSSGRTAKQHLSTQGAASLTRMHNGISAAHLIAQGTATDREVMKNILQLSTRLSLMAGERGRSEQDLADMVIASCKSFFAPVVDMIIMWQVQPGAAGSDGKLVAVASDAKALIGKEIDLSDDESIPACAAFLASSFYDSPPLMVNKADKSACSSLAALYSIDVRGALYVPLNAEDPNREGNTTECTQIGVLELVLQNSSSLPEAAEDGSIEQEGDCFTPLRCEQMRQLGSSLANALQAIRLANKDQQGERLLYRMLPRHIVTQLQTRAPEDFLVESCEKAFVLFSDIVSFTKYCATRDPQDVVIMLNSMFATFDALLEKHNVHKVTTIGDAYVAATGLNFMDSETPQLDIVSFALDMVAAVRSFVTVDGERMQIRIGIHAGPVAAGVVGIAMPRYCLFGETVAIAEQLEERSASGRILISEAVYESLQEDAVHKRIKESFSTPPTYQMTDKPLQHSGGGEGKLITTTKTYFINERAHRRRQSLNELEEMATEKLSYFLARTTGDATANALSRSATISFARDRTLADSSGLRNRSMSMRGSRLIASPWKEDGDQPEGMLEAMSRSPLIISAPLMRNSKGLSPRAVTMARSRERDELDDGSEDLGVKAPFKVRGGQRERRSASDSSTDVPGGIPMVSSLYNRYGEENDGESFLAPLRRVGPIKPKPSAGASVLRMADKMADEQAYQEQRTRRPSKEDP